MTQETDESRSEKLDRLAKEAWDFSPFLVLTLYGLMGMLFPLFPLFHDFFFPSVPDAMKHDDAMKLEVSIILHVLGMLSLFIGIGLYSHFRRTEAHFSKDEEFSETLKKDIKSHFDSDTDTHRLIKEELEENKKLLLSLLGGRFLSNYKEIYNCLISLATNAKSEIKLLVYGKIWLGRLPDAWSKALAEHLKVQKKEHYNNINYKVVGCIPIKEQYEFFNTLTSRLDIYKQHEVNDLVKLRLIDDRKPIGLNMLIVDKKHVALTFSQHGENEVDSCIIFEERSDIAKQLASWFDECVFNPATSFEDVLKDLNKETKQDQ